jgi:CheY-like chemotaxis protein
VTTAGSLRDALACFDPGRHQLLISDLALPDGTGHELVRALHERAGELPAVALSGFGTDDDVRASLEAGFDAHLTKPVDLEALLGAVQRLTAR